MQVIRPKVPHKREFVVIFSGRWICIIGGKLFPFFFISFFLVIIILSFLCKYRKIEWSKTSGGLSKEGNPEKEGMEWFEKNLLAIVTLSA